MLLSLLRRTLPGSALLLLLIVSSGCDNTISPFSREGTFAIYGVLDLSERRQFIRVKDLTTPLVGPAAAEPLEVRVTLEDVDAGTTWRLRDSVIVFDEVYTHNFWVDLTPRPDTEYRVTVEGADGTVTRATTRTPRPITPTAIPAEGDCLTQFTVSFPGMRDVRRLFQVDIGYLPAGATSPNTPPPPDGDRDTDDANNQERIWVSATDAESARIVDFGGTNDIELRFTPEPILSTTIPSIDTPPESIYRPRCWELGDDRLLVAYVQLGPEWFNEIPLGAVTFDPTQSGFVENGLGFLGAIRRDTLAIPVDTSDVIMVFGAERSAARHIP